jgi:glyoxylase-like metal-dependent hydrolase (beta-lactamase superfamily II)
VVVQCDGLDYFLAGDTSYTQEILLEGESDGVSPKPSVTVETLQRILTHASHRPTVYLPSHDPASEERLTQRSALQFDGLSGVGTSPP